MEAYDLVINNGTILNADGTQKANIGIRNGKIAVLSDLPLAGSQVIDASKQWVLPGVIDPHVHFALKQGQGDDATVTEDDYASGPRAAAVGGVTTFIDFAISPRARSPQDYLKERIALARAGSCIDFSFHAGVTNPDPAVLSEFPKIVEMGIPSFKFFITYRKWEFAVDLGFLYGALKRLQDLEGAACIHAEDDEIVEWLRHQYAKQPELIYHSWSRPDFTEEISVSDMVTLARETGGRLYIVHLTTRKALNVIRQAKAQGIVVHAETCPHYLEFTDEVYKENKGVLYTMTPPLRAPGNKEALWEGLKDKSLSIVSSDHNALSGALKKRKPHWLDVPPGLAGSEMVLTYLHSQGVATGFLSPQRMVELVSANPARLFGVPNKGAVRIGYDADLVVFDPKEKRSVHYQDLATPIDFTIFEGMEMTGWPNYTISHGKVIVDHGKFIGQPGSGQFIERKIDPTAWLA
jgi:dihydropyrimidinase